LATWAEFARSEPDYARLVKARFDSHKHKMMATLRKDGSPRISGIEATFANGQLCLGMMPGSLKALDLQRDPRLALHNAPLDSEMVDGDAKIAGLAVEHTDEGTKAEFSG
jgi:Pyridoxamine 5'-phosphate oxidase